MFSGFYSYRDLDVRKRYILIALTLLPLLVLTAVIVKFHVTVPMGDSWDSVPLIAKYLHGQAGIADIWQQHNEHRCPIGALLMLPIVKWTSWNTLYWLALGLMFGIGIFVVLARQVAATSRALRLPGLVWMLPPLSITVFSLCQSENWLWECGTSGIMTLFFAVTGFVFLVRERFSWWSLILAVLMGILAMYTLANGAMYWPVGLAVLLMLPAREGENRKVTLLLWLAVTALAFFTYLYGYHKPTHHPSFAAAVEQPVEFVSYFLKYLGNPAVPHIPVAGLLSGAAILVLYIAALWTLAVRRRVSFTQLAPYAALGLYSIGNALLTAMSRTGFGSNQAFCSRYITIANPVWISALVLLFILSAYGKNAQSTRRPALVCIWVITVLMAVHSAGAMKGVLITYRNQLEVREQLLLGRPDSIPDKNLEYLKILKENRLSIFRGR